MAGSRRSRTVLLDPSRPTSVWTVLVLLAALLTSFCLLSMFMAHDHAWTERVVGRLALPGSPTSLAADSSLSAQLRIDNATAWYGTLADQTPILVVRTDILNEALIEVDNVILEARALSATGATLAVRTGTCGKVVSSRLLGRLRRDELDALFELALAAEAAAAPGSVLHCQIVFAGLESGASEVLLRIVSAEPLAGHSPPLFRPTG